MNSADVAQFKDLAASPIRSDAREAALMRWHAHKQDRQVAHVMGEKKARSKKSGRWTKGDYVKSLTSRVLDLSGAVFEPRALDELIPDWKDKGAPLNSPVTEERFLMLSESGSIGVPIWALPAQMHNHGNYVVSLGNVCRWLGEQAEELGAEIYPGFAAAEVLYDERGRVTGVATGDMGIGRDGGQKDGYQPGMELRAKYTFFAEGCRGSLSKSLTQRFGLRDGKDPQTYGIGIKELWQLDPGQHRQGLVMHTAGWPMNSKTWGGSFIYHLEEGQAYFGFVVGLDYQNPHLSTFHEFQRFKTHPAIRPMLEGEVDPRLKRRPLTAVECVSQHPDTMLLGLLAGQVA